MTAATPQPCLLTVIFPVYDLRGDVVERVRRWTRGQDLEPGRYRVCVLAGPEAKFDEAGLHNVLRNHDLFVRLPSTGRDADYWNEGARRATTPWLLFVEAHAVPARDSLSALASWIDSGPDSPACNFRVQSRSDHRVTRLLERWFDETHAGWSSRATWPRLHRTACAIRRDAFEEAGPFEPAYGQFAPPLLSAHMHRRGQPVVMLPAAKILHEDLPVMAPHHEDTADYARGEAEARAANDPAFFEAYFGPSPFQTSEANHSPDRTRAIVFNAIGAILRRHESAKLLLPIIRRFVSAAIWGLPLRIWLLAAMTRLDEYAVMYAPVPLSLQWKRFLLAHRRVVHVEQLRWSTRNPPVALQAVGAADRSPIDKIDQQTILGVHAIEQFEAAPFRWTRPAFLIRVAFSGSAVLQLETRGLRGEIHPSEITVVANGRFIDDVTIDTEQTIAIRVSPRDQATEGDILVFTTEVCEPAAGGAPGRRLGLPLFSVSMQRVGA
ncbi:MAG: glycosyltransferase [bacterium]|nr:glycosyltransferase [bacterium]